MTKIGAILKRITLEESLEEAGRCRDTCPVEHNGMRQQIILLEVKVMVRLASL